MAEDKKTEQTEQEEPQDEGADASAAGPVAEEDSSSSQAADEEPTPAPPAEEAEEQPSAEAPPAAEAEGEVEAPPAAEGEDLPWKVARRLERSRRPHEAGPQRSPEERATARHDARRAKSSARSRYRRSARAKAEAGTGTPPAERRANPPKVRQGVVVSDKADKTITVRIDIVRRHSAYEKIVRRSRTLHAHDERNEAGAGDVVRVVETRPLSRTKRWRLLEILEKAK
jgi:small subunit ribosomal protein S17